MIGDLCLVGMPFYSTEEQVMKQKVRPALIIGEADSSNVTVLPVSTIHDQRRIDQVFDLLVDPDQYPDSRLKTVSYIRTNKVYTVNRKNITMTMCNLKAVYPELYLTATSLFEQYTMDIAKRW